MIGAIEYLRSLQQLCDSNNGNCKNCRVGKQQKLHETLCPRLTTPNSWNRDKIAKMVFKGAADDNRK